tara:strand:- start:1293 stop:1583 length:291 start_codon:yes stop_codon:yes gene_type:complete
MSRAQFKAILEINPNAKFIIRGDNPVEWIEGTTPISEDIINAKISEIATRDAHIEPRVKAYPSIEDQLDMQYHDQVNGTTTWKDAIQAVKDANPKA